MAGSEGAAQATLHCLTGCAIGEVLGMVIGTAAGLPNLPTVIMSIALAFVFGYGLTVRSVLRAGVGLRAAVRAALAADTASIAVMELADNAVILAVPGAMDAGLGAALFWAALAFLIGPRHPAPLNGISGLDRKHTALAIFGLIVFVLLLMPVPLISVNS